MTLFGNVIYTSTFDKRCIFLFNLYNTYAKMYGFKKALKLTVERKRNMGAVMNYTLQDLFLFLSEFQKSLPFFQASEWFSFDWIIKEDNFIKVMEGKYSTQRKDHIKSSVEYKTRNF